jgi:hypothetical protein
MNEHLLDYPLAPRPFYVGGKQESLDLAHGHDIYFELNGVATLAVGKNRHHIPLEELLRMHNQVNAALSPWLDYQDAVDKCFDFDTENEWQLRFPRNIGYSFTVYDDPVKLKKHVNILAFKPLDWASERTKEACKRIKVWKESK